ncbi:hypothetical protein POM88_033117 [Heracleum sosnowskyi]|uniref:Uncharacterized protein n=1 Tax=Heracleum sosnowskyi TaxID=360622 RepID=A0AAD8MLJ3_9APIA|nr:hypothetical protein POM88_033117 [Heracleum sosnowskyi]
MKVGYSRAGEYGSSNVSENVATLSRLPDLLEGEINIVEMVPACLQVGLSSDVHSMLGQRSTAGGEHEAMRKIKNEFMPFDLDKAIIRCLERRLGQRVYNNEMLSLGQDLGQRFLPAFDTPTGLPYAWINLKVLSEIWI